MEKTKLYAVRKDVKCLECGNKGAVLLVGERTSMYEIDPYAFVGSESSYSCLNCSNSGSIDTSLGGKRVAFETVQEGNSLSEMEKMKLAIKGHQFYYNRRGFNIPRMDTKKAICGHISNIDAPCCKSCADKWFNQYLREEDKPTISYQELMNKPTEELREELSQNLMTGLIPFDIGFSMTKGNK